MATTALEEAATSAPDDSWWGRPAGGREVLAIAAPMIVSSLSWTVMTFIDRVFLSHVSGAAMAAAFASSVVWFSALSLPLGVTMYVGTFVAQYFGEGRRDRIGPSVWQGVKFSLAFSPLILVSIPLAPHLFALADHEPEVLALEVRYFQILCWGAPGLLLAQALSCFYSGRGRTGVVAMVDGAAAVLNLVLDYAMIFGRFGFPAMGIDGAGWATVIALWAKAAAYAALVYSRDNRVLYGTWKGVHGEGPLFRRLVYYGGPSGLQLLLDVAGFTTFVMMVGRLGVLEAEATGMAFSISTLAFMPIWGIGVAGQVLVGQHLGENREELAARAVWTALALGLAYMGAISLLFLAAPGLFLAGFFAAGDSAAQASHAEALRRTATVLLRFVAAYNLLDAAQMIFVSALKGAGDTGFILRVSMVMATSLAIVSYASVSFWNLGLYGCWALIACWVWALGAVYYLRFQQGKWRKMRVTD